MKKWVLPILLSLIALVLIVVDNLTPKPERIDFVVERVDRIIVSNRGNYNDFDRRYITSRDTTARIRQLLAIAKRVSFDTVDTRAVRFARVQVRRQGQQDDEFSYSVTFQDGNLIWYHGSRFRSDSLDVYLR